MDVIINYIEETIKDLSPEDKFKTLNYIEECVQTVRQHVSEEWTYCAICKKYVRDTERELVTDGGIMLLKCGECGGVHHVWRI